MTNDRFVTLMAPDKNDRNEIPVTCTREAEHIFVTVIVWDKNWNPVEVKVKRMVFNAN
jgi:hypothetical protein